MSGTGYDFVTVANRLPVDLTVADDVVVSVVAATSFEAWDVHIGLGRTPRQVRRAWTLAVDRLVPGVTDGAWHHL